MIYTLRSLLPSAFCSTPAGSGGTWVSAMPLPYYGGHLRGAWEVLRGRAVAIRYPKNGEFETACEANGWKVGP